MAKATAAHAEQTCGCVFCPFGNYFLYECKEHAALRATAEKKRKKPGKPTKKPSEGPT